MTQAVLLDLYGTLVEPEWARLTAGRDAIADRVGAPRRSAHAAWTETHQARMRGAHGSLEGDLAAVFAAAGVGGAIGEPVLAELAALERANWRDGVHVYPDVVPALHRLRSAGVRLAIVTNASAEAASVIPALGLDALVELVMASCEARAVKPELLELTLRRLGVDPPDAMLVDDEPGQVVAARRMGMQASLVRRGADFGEVVTDLTGVADLLLGAASARR